MINLNNLSVFTYMIICLTYWLICLIFNSLSLHSKDEDETQQLFSINYNQWTDSLV